jgi:hypothetical protein
MQNDIRDMKVKIGEKDEEFGELEKLMIDQEDSCTELQGFTTSNVIM